jgi:hypothetical protein
MINKNVTLSSFGKAETNYGKVIISSCKAESELRKQYESIYQKPPKFKY